MHLYASYGKGFQTPLDWSWRIGLRSRYTGVEFRVGRPARSNNGEIGAKFATGGNFSADVAAFDSTSNDGKLE